MRRLTFAGPLRLPFKSVPINPIFTVNYIAGDQLSQRPRWKVSCCESRFALGELNAATAGLRLRGYEVGFLEQNAVRTEPETVEPLELNAALVRRAPDQIACDMGGEVVILDLKSGTYYGLDVVAARIWALIEQPLSIVAIRQAITAEYDVDAATCERDVMTFLNQMRDAGLVEITSDSHR